MPVDVPFACPYVVKLADVAHRTEHGAVRLAVPAERLGEVTAELRSLAARDGLPELVAVQKMITAQGEAFIGVRGQSELGPVVAFGLGGVFVEVLGRVSGRLAPFTVADAGEMIAEFDDLGVLDGVRGRGAWDRDALAAILVQVSLLAAAWPCVDRYLRHQPAGLRRRALRGRGRPLPAARRLTAGDFMELTGVPPIPPDVQGTATSPRGCGTRPVCGTGWSSMLGTAPATVALARRLRELDSERAAWKRRSRGGRRRPGRARDHRGRAGAGHRAADRGGRRGLSHDDHRCCAATRRYVRHRRCGQADCPARPGPGRCVALRSSPSPDLATRLWTWPAWACLVLSVPARSGSGLACAWDWP